jgi:hypothetical protein
LLDLHEMLAVAHADSLVVDELAVAGDGDGTGGDGELLAEGCGYAAHLAALLAVGTAVLGLRERFEGGDWDGCCRGGGEKVFEEGAASEGVVWHKRGISFGRSRGVCLEKLHFILPRGKVKESGDCCRFSAAECVNRRIW